VALDFLLLAADQLAGLFLDFAGGFLDAALDLLVGCDESKLRPVGSAG
jgi:hypothetical protein